MGFCRRRVKSKHQYGIVKNYSVNRSKLKSISNRLYVRVGKLKTKYPAFGKAFFEGRAFRRRRII